MTVEDVSASDMLALRSFPLSRQQYALRRIDEALVECEDESLRRWVAEAIRLGDRARNLELEWRGTPPTTEHGERAQEVDHELDRALSALHGVLSTTAHAFGERSTRGAAARLALERLFPSGLRAVIQLPFVTQEDTVRILLERTTRERLLARALRELDVGELLERIAAIHVRYGEALPREQPSTPSYEQVQAARRAGQERLGRIVFVLVTRLLEGGLGGQHAAALRAALDEVLSQDAAIRRYSRQRRRAADVDPETGEPVEDVEGDAPGDVDAA